MSRRGGTIRASPKSPPATSENVRKTMSANKSKDTKPELVLRGALRQRGMVGYRVNWKGALGRPDIAFTKYKVAIFVHGCYWHRCPTCNLPIPKSNSGYWIEKFSYNQERDERIKCELEREGWTVLYFWECEVCRNLKWVVDEVSSILNKSVKKDSMQKVDKEACI